MPIFKKSAGGGGGGGGSPGGSSGAAQWNNSGNFAGFGNWNGTLFDLGAFNSAATQVGINYSNVLAASFAVNGTRGMQTTNTMSVAGFPTLSYGGWFYRLGNGGNSGSSLGTFFSTDGSSGGFNRGVGVTNSGASTPNKIAVNAGPSHGQFFSTQTFSNNTWYYIGVVYTSSNIKIYVNGALDSSSGFGYAGADTSGVLVFGASNYSGDNQNLNGFLEEPQIWTTDQSANFLTYYNSGAGTYGSATAGLRAAYHFDGTMTDYSGNGFNGTDADILYVSSPKCVNPSPTINTKYFTYLPGTGLEFDGSPLGTVVPSPWHQVGGLGTPITQIDTSASVQFAQIIQDGSSISSVDPNGRVLYGIGGGGNIFWDYSGTGNVAISQSFYSTADGQQSIDPNNRLQYDGGNLLALTYASRSLVQSDGGTPCVDWTGSGNNGSAALSFAGLTDAYFTGAVHCGTFFASGLISSSPLTVGANVINNASGAFSTPGEFNAGNSGSAITLNFTTNGPNQKVALTTGATTITLAGGVVGQLYKVRLVQGASSTTVAWSTVKWPGGTAPTITATNGKFDILDIYFDGTNYDGRVYGQNY